MTDAVVQLDGLSHAYPGGTFRLSLDSLGIPRGSVTALIGPSGSGKTTLLNMIAGIIEPRRGTININGTPITGIPESRRRALRIRSVGMVFQEFELVEHLSVLDNVLLPLRLGGASRVDRAARDLADELLGHVGLIQMRRRTPRRLSQGERQRVGLCRALINEPSLVLADEPTGNLDPETTWRVIGELIERVQEAHATLIMATHDHSILDRFDQVIDLRTLATETGP